LKKNILLLSIVLTLISCGGTTNKFSSGDLEKSEKYKINSYYGCCGLFAYYFNIYKYGKKQEQIVYKYTDAKTFLPTKYIFNYGKGGHLLYCDRYIATKNNDFEIGLTENEKVIFLLLDTDTSGKFGNKSMRFSDIKGFRKPKEKEVTHPFPLMRKGYKVKQQ